MTKNICSFDPPHSVQSNLFKLKRKMFNTNSFESQQSFKFYSRYTMSFDLKIKVLFC